MRNLQLLRYLFRLRDRWVLPQAIVSDLDLRAETVHQDLEALLREGYGIEYHPTFGYRFRPGEELLDPHRLQEGLETSLVGSEVHCLLEVPSTMDVAWSLFEEGRPSGTVVLAERQRKGRGRFGRPWESPRGGGIWMSVLLRREGVPEPASLLTVASAIAIAEAVEEQTGLQAAIRWPNDIVIRERKAGGILIEMRQEGGRPGGVVVGIGINVDIAPSDLPPPLQETATSLFREAGRRVDRAGLVRGVFASLDRWHGRVMKGEVEALGERWRALSTNLGKRVTLTRKAERFEGVVVDLDPVRGLSLDLGGGEVRTFPAEQVSLG